MAFVQQSKTAIGGEAMPARAHTTGPMRCRIKGKCRERAPLLLWMAVDGLCFGGRLREKSDVRSKTPAGCVKQSIDSGVEDVTHSPG